jgi:hypothetical protein
MDLYKVLGTTPVPKKIYRIQLSGKALKFIVVPGIGRQATVVQ